MDFWLFLLASTRAPPNPKTAVTRPVQYFSQLTVSHPQSPPTHISKRVCRRNRARMGAVTSGREAAAHRADTADWSMGSGGREEFRRHGCRLSGPGAAGDREDQACHRHHRECQATGEESGIKGWGE